MDLLAKQLRYTLRSLGRSPAFTATAVLTLALGIGATTAIFSVVHGVLLKPLPFAEPERLVEIGHEAPGLSMDEIGQSPALYFTYRDEGEAFADSGMWSGDVVTVTGKAESVELPALRVTDGTLPLLGVRPHLGRLFSAADDSPGRTSMDPIFLEDFPVPEGQIPALRRFKWIAPGYFETLTNPILAGRAISWADVHERRRVAVVTRNFALEYWDDPAAALGRRIRINPGSPWREIVGVVGDVRDAGVDQEATAIVYWPMAIAEFWGEELFVPRSMAFAVRSPRVGSESFLEEVRAAVWSVNPRLPLAQVRTLDEILAGSLARTSFTLVMLGIAAATALLLGGVGIYGVTAYSVAQRSRQIGVRMALGARRSDVSRLVLRQGLALAGIGVVVGLGAAVGLTRLMSALLFGVAPLDPPTFAAAGLGAALLALAASWLPARRAARVDPVETLY